ncbi:MAG TPA: G1 family glutamic endopeptidase [Methylocella sp.]|nr:G1 family glutamic endopeptidase [Methylocella sp.]
MKFTNRKIRLTIIFGLLGFAASTLTLVSAFGQNAPAIASNTPPEGTVLAESPIGIKQVPIGIKQVESPPIGFDPAAMSAGDRLRYAIPPAPDAVMHPDEYEHWKRVVSAMADPKKRVQTTLMQTKIRHGPARKLNVSPTSGPVHGVGTLQSSNWSGTAVYDPSDRFKVEAIFGAFVVPAARQAVGVCDGGWDYASFWVGIDGLASNSNDVLQAGFDSDAYCAANGTSTCYCAWIEWFPNNAIYVNFPFSPGDLIWIEVWNTSATTGYAYLYNYSTEQYASYVLTPPAGTALVGNSVEWIVERPSIGSGTTLATLANYNATSMYSGFAWNYNASSPTYQYAWQPPASGNIYAITMLDDSGKPISNVGAPQLNFLWFWNSGSSY